MCQSTQMGARLKTRLILLAAGNSRRFGSNKLLYNIDGRPMFTYGLKVMEELLLEDYNRELYVVTRFASVEQAVNELKENPRLQNRIRIIHSKESVLGVSYSIHAGLIEGETEGGKEPDYYLFMVSDQPFIKAATVSQLIKTTIEQQKIGGCITWKGTLGNPVIFSKQLKKELLELKEDQGGKKVLRRYLDEICQVEASKEEELRDKDTIENC